MLDAILALRVQRMTLSEGRHTQIAHSNAVSMGAILPSGGLLTMTGDICSCHSWGDGTMGGI